MNFLEILYNDWARDPVSGTVGIGFAVLAVLYLLDGDTHGSQHMIIMSLIVLGFRARRLS